MLKRYRIKEEEGFRKLILSIEQSAEDKQKQILQAMFLEDPVYAQFIPLNILSFKYIMNLDSSEIHQIWDSSKNSARTFVFAFFGSEEEEQFLVKLLPNELHHQYNEEKEITRNGVASYQRRTARFNLITSVRELQDNLRIKNFNWKYPSKQVLKGDHLLIPKKGKYTLYYDNDQLAMEGEYEDRVRSGSWTHYYSNGNLMAKGICNLGEKDDLWEFYYPSGKLRAKGRYFQNLKEGEWIEIDGIGIEKVNIYKKGQISTC
jgi:hypothetical protein